MKTPILLRGSFAGILLVLLVLAGGMPTSLAQDLETLRKDRVAVIEKALTLMTLQYREGMRDIDLIVPLRAELLHAHSELDLPRDQRLIFLKEAEQEARKFAELARAICDAGMGRECDALLAKAGQLAIEIRLLEMKDNTAGLAQDLETLRKSRVGTLEQAVARMTFHYSEGMIEIDPIMPARNELLKARLESSLPQAKKITLVENAILQVRKLEKLAQGRVEAGSAHQSDALVTEAGRLGMEIKLLKLKGKSGKPAQDAETLRKNRVAALEKIVAMLAYDYRQGLLGIEQVISCQIELLETQSELDLSRVQKIALLEEALKQAGANEEVAQIHFNAGQVTSSDRLLAKAGRLRIEIRLLELKALGDGPPKKGP